MKKIVVIMFIVIFAITSQSIANEKRLTYKTGYLANGLKFIVAERNELPLVSMGMMIKAGIYHEKKPGVANMLASTLIYGNKYMRPNDVVSQLDFLGSSVSVTADYDSIEIGASMLSNSAERVMKIISRIVRLPSFIEPVLNNFKNQTISALKAQKDNISDKARMQFYKIIYGEHPYARNAMGDEESVSSMTRNDLFDFHSKYFVPNNTVIVYVGNINFDKAEKITKQYFESWKQKPLPAEKTFTPLPLKRRVNIMSYPTTQGFVRMGHISLARNNPMYYKLLVYNAILGGSGFGSRLTQTIREKHGLTYGIVSYFYVYRKKEGYFHINFSTDLSRVKFAVQKIYEVLNEYLKKGPTQEELNSIKRYLTGLFIMMGETPEQIISRFLSMELYNLEPYYWDNETKIINSLTLEDLKKTGEFIKKELFSIIVVIDKNKVSLTEADILPKN